MAQRQATKRKKSSKINAIIWGIILIVLMIAVVFSTSEWNNDIKKKVQNQLCPLSYNEYVEKAAKDYNLSPALIYGIIRTESNFNPDAGSVAGACGLMQIMPETFDHYMMLRGETGKYTAEDLFDPAVNIDYGSYILHHHIEMFGDEKTAVAAYNAGAGSVEQWLDDPNISPDGKTLNCDNIPYEETRNYVVKVEDAKDKYNELYYSN